MTGREGAIRIGVDTLNDLIVDLPIQQVEDLSTGVTTIHDRISRTHHLQPSRIPSRNRFAADWF